MGGWAGTVYEVCESSFRFDLLSCLSLLIINYDVRQRIRLKVISHQDCVLILANNVADHLR